MNFLKKMSNGLHSLAVITDAISNQVQQFNLSNDRHAPRSFSPPSLTLDSPLLLFGNGDIVRISELTEGVFIAGATGSGKSSSIGALLAQQLLAIRLWEGRKTGGLVLCAKPDEIGVWRRYLASAGRIDDAIILEAGGGHSYNFFEEEAKANPDTENLIAMFLEVLSITQEKKQSSDSYWMDGVRELLRNGIDLLKSSREKMTLNALCSIIDQAPLSIADADSKEWQESSYCYQAVEKAAGHFAEMKNKLQSLSPKEREKLQSEERDFKVAYDYFLSKFPSLDERPRSGIVSMWSGLVDMFRRGVMADLFCSKTSFSLSDLEQGKILILNLPVLGAMKETGRVAQVLMKYLFQRHIQARDVSLSPAPVVIWADEAHYFCSQNDVMFMTTARSSRVITVYISQTVRNLQEVLGHKGEISADALLAGFQTKVFCCNGDDYSNQWASRLIGSVWTSRGGYSKGQSQQDSSPTTTRNDGFNVNEQLTAQIDPVKFTQLRKGGVSNSFYVDCIIFQPGKLWANGKNHLEITLHQKQING